MLVYGFNFDLFEFSAAILEKGLLAARQEKILAKAISRGFLNLFILICFLNKTLPLLLLLTILVQLITPRQ